jgi:hypothetical protein
MQTQKYQSHFKMTIYQLAIAIFTSRHYHINVVFDYSKSMFSSLHKSLFQFDFAVVLYKLLISSFNFYFFPVKLLDI